MNRLLAALALALFATTAVARPPAEPIRTSEPPKALGPGDGSLSLEPRFAISAPNTTVLASYSFDVGGTCSQQGWTVADGTAQIAVFWHVDDFVGANVNPGDSLAVLAGSKSLWCGARAAATGPMCGYLVLPGYGSNWNQVWQTKNCIPVTGNLDVSFLMETDSEPNYDATILEYTSECVDPKPLSDWDELDGGVNGWDGIQSISHSASYAVVGNPVRVRLRFLSDWGFADDDGLYDSHAGPVVVDNLTVEGLAMEDFEGEGVGTTESNDWEGDVIPGYGS